MSALDLFAMLNTPLNGGGAGASAPGQTDAATGDAFAGLLSLLAPEGEAAALTSTAVRGGVSQAAFRPVTAGLLNLSDAPTIAPALSAGVDAEEELASETDDTGQILSTPVPNGVTPALTSAQGAAGGNEARVSSTPATGPVTPPSPLSGSGAPPISPDASAGAPSQKGSAATAPVPPGAVFAAAGAPAAGTPGQTRTSAADPANSPPGFGPSQPSPAKASPSTAEAALRNAPHTSAVTPSANGAPASAGEAARAAVQTMQPPGSAPPLAAAAQAAEAARPAQMQQTETPRGDRRAERRDGEARPTLFASAETGETPRPSAAAAGPQTPPGAAPETGAPRPGPAAVEARTDPAPLPVDPVAVEGEADAGPARTPDSPGAASVREHLPTTLARAGIETTAMLSAQIVRRLEARSTRFDMVLTPEDLGRVDVRMEVDQDGQLTARLAFDNPAAAAELRGRADELRRQLEAAGFQMSEGSLEFAEREGGRRDEPFDRRERAFSGAGRLTADADAVSAPPRWTALSLTPEGVDMKV